MAQKETELCALCVARASLGEKSRIRFYENLWQPCELVAGCIQSAINKLSALAFASLRAGSSAAQVFACIKDKDIAARKLVERQ